MNPRRCSAAVCLRGDARKNLRGAAAASVGPRRRCAAGGAARRASFAARFSLG